jgi:hypothetical protein
LIRIAHAQGLGWRRCGFNIRKKLDQRSPHWRADRRALLIAATLIGFNRGGVVR